MPEGSLQRAIDMAESVRYSGDTMRSRSEGSDFQSAYMRGLFNLNGLKISREVSPSLGARIQNVCDRLLVPIDAVDSFVYLSSEVQAECYASSTSRCVLRFTSALVNLLEGDEFEYVVGHELGHFLLGHNIARAETLNESIELMMLQRSQEVSADRIGLIASESLDACIRAMMKTVSGLGSNMLRLDVGTFLSQLKNTPSGGMMSTHPIMLVRCKALLWFSLKGLVDVGINRTSEIDLLDRRIKLDFEKYVDREAKDIINKVLQDLKVWMIAEEIVKDGKFEKDEQFAFKAMFGSETYDSFMGFVKGFSFNDLVSEIQEKIEIKVCELARLIPESADEEIQKLKLKIASEFSNLKIGFK